MSTFDINRQGRTVAKFRAPKVSQHGVNRFVWTLAEADGTVIGTIYLSTDKHITVEEVKHATDSTTVGEEQSGVSAPAPVRGVEESS